MWLLSWLPDWVVHVTLVVAIISAVVGSLLSGITFSENTGKIVKVIGIIVATLAIYLEGGIAKDQEYRATVEEYNTKVAEAEAASAEANTKLVEAIAKQDELRKEKKNATTKIITQVITKTDDSKCTLSNAYIRVHDSASQDQLPPSPDELDGSPSGIAPSTFLNTVTGNYSTCYKLRDTVLGWQAWYLDQKKIFESVQ